MNLRTEAITMWFNRRLVMRRSPIHGIGTIDLSPRANSTHYVALRPILANQEVTADYYDETALDVCACKSPGCRWLHRKPKDT
jgi:hypothetical protein